MNGLIGWSAVVLVLAALTAQAAPLTVGQTVDGTVADAASGWTLQLKAGDLVRGRVQGDVSLRLLDGQGRPERLLADGLDLPRDFLFIAPREGEFRLRAEPVATRPGEHYQLTVQQVLGVGEQHAVVTPIASPLLAKLAGGGDTEAFWQARKAEGTPLVETIPGKPDMALVTFLWRGARDNVRLFGAPSGNHDELQRLGATDVWFRSYEVPATARLSYQMAPDVPPGDRRMILATTQVDPLNPRRFADDSGDPYRSRSRLELPAAPPQPWVAERAGVARGTLERQRVRSVVLGNERDVYVYRPAGWKDGGAGQGLLVLFDAHAYTRQVPTPTILDNLLADGLIPPTAALIVANSTDESRQVELPPNPLFARFMDEELMPWAKARGLAAPASRTVVAGSSFGGLVSGYLGLVHPQWFGNVLSLSGSYWWAPEDVEPEWLTREYVRAERKPLKFYLQAGLFEGPRILDTNRHLRDVLQAKGYAVTQVEYPAGHDYLQWRGSLPCGLIELIGTGRPQACIPR